jgi:UDP-2-acetamido-2-deoxy-ribo-hexuluronate aminotransferase
VLLSKLTVFEAELAAREAIARAYDAALGDVVQVPARMPRATSAWAIYAILLQNWEARTRLQEGLRAAGVPTAIYYPRPLHLQPAYRHAHDGTALPVAEDLATRILALPIHPDLSEADVALVTAAVRANV